MNPDSWQRFKDGDETAFAALMRGHFGILYNYGTKFSRDTELVKDCIQELFLNLWQQRQKLPPVESVKAYLMTALRNRLLRSLQKQQRFGNELVTDYDLFSTEFSIEEQLIDEETIALTARRISQLMNTLTRRQKEVIYLRYYQNLDRSAIAQVMNVSEQSVSNLLREALKNLRNEWLGAGVILFLLLFL